MAVVISVCFIELSPSIMHQGCYKSVNVYLGLSKRLSKGLSFWCQLLTASEVILSVETEKALPCRWWPGHVVGVARQR